ncbi:hypothetical protein ACI3PL_30360, partial [Lacticaseibacillus paracasei]
CEIIREVENKQVWMKGEEPFIRNCRPCSNKGTKTLEHCEKISASVKKTQTPEVLEKKSQFMKDHPEIWQQNLDLTGDAA